MVKMFNMYKGLPRSIYILFIARVVNSMGMFVYPFLTLFLSKKIGLSDSEIGFYMLLASTTFVPGAFLGGKLTDHFGRKKILLIFQSLAALTFISCGFMGNSMIVTWLLITASLFNGIADPATGAMVTDLTEPKNRKAAFSLLYLGINIGVAIGPIIAGFLFENYTRWIFWGDGLTTVIALSLVLIYVPDTKPTEKEIKQTNDKLSDSEKAELGSVFKALLKRPFLIGFAIIYSLLTFSYSQHAFSIPLQLNDIFGDASSKMFGTIMSVNAIVVLIMTVPLTNLTKNLKPVQNVSIVGILYALGFGMIYYIDYFPFFILSTILWTMGEILAVTNVGVYIANHSPITHRGRFSSFLNILSGAGYALGPAIMGIYIESFGVRQVWILLFFISMGAFILLNLHHRIEVWSKKKVLVRKS
ncbi:MAG: MFS transporter [Firmicutes bacterium]|nr:MFS transporter [Bacillota bacterium]